MHAGYPGAAGYTAIPPGPSPPHYVHSQPPTAAQFSMMGNFCTYVVYSSWKLALPPGHFHVFNVCIFAYQQDNNNCMLHIAGRGTLFQPSYQYPPYYQPGYPLAPGYYNSLAFHNWPQGM